MTNTSDKPRHAFSSWLRTYWVTSISVAISAVSVLLTVYIWQDSKVAPELIAVMQPTRATIVSSDAIPKLKIYHEGQEVQKPVIAVQLAIWNEGRQSIRKDSVLSPVTLVTSPPVEIVDISVTKSTRDLVGFQVDSAQFKKGLATFNWNILEQGDGVALQIIYIGEPDISIGLSGAVEGQRQVQLFRGEASKRIQRARYPTPISRTVDSATNWVAAILGSCLVAFLLGYWTLLILKKINTAQASKLERIFDEILPIVTITAVLSLLLFSVLRFIDLFGNLNWVPPFDF